MGEEAQIQAARVRSVYERQVATSLITVVNAALVTTVMERARTSPGPFIWLGLVAALAGVRAASWRYYRRDQRQGRRLRLWNAASVGGSTLSGAFWGLGAALLFPPDETGQWLWIFLIAGMCAGAASLHAAHLPTALAFMLPAAAPLAVRLALEGSPSRLAAAAMIVVFLMAIAFTASRFSRQFGEVLRLQLDLERRTAELDDSNARLRAEMEQHRATADTLHQAQKMEALGHITGGVAHDFNNLLTVITGSIDLIRRRAGADETIQRLAAAANHAARRGARLTGDLLSFARKQPLDPEAVDVNALVAEFAPLLRRACGEAIDLSLELAAAAPAALADAAHFQSAVLNLVINARDAMPAGGRLVVATRNAEPDAGGAAPDGWAHAGRAVVVSVRDSGAGMPAEVAARAFEPFFTTKGVGKGSGLGLSQVYGFARQSGGYAEIHSAPGQGTEVSIVLPALPAGHRPRRRVPHAPPAAPLVQPLHVLLAEDDAAVAATLGEALALRGWEVIHASAGEAALELLEQRPDIDVLVSDVVMAGALGGVALARAASALRPGLPVLLISGYAGEALSAGGVREGEFDLLPKPFTHQALAERIQAAVGRRHAAEQAAACEAGG